MAPALTEGLQHTPAPSQFARFKNTEPSTTASGVTPGRAVFDTPSPNRAPSPELARSQQTRKPLTRKLESSQQQVSHSSGSKSKCTKTMNSNGSHANTGNTSHVGTSELLATSGSQAGGTNMANRNTTNADSDGNDGNDNDNDEDDDNFYVSQQVIDQLKALVGHSVSHLSNRRLKELLDAIPQTQVSALGTQAEPSQAITKLPSRVGLAGRDHNRSPPHEGTDNHPPPQTQPSTSPAPPQKRPISALDTPLTASKHVRIAAAEQDNNSATEDEDEDEPEIRISVRRRHHHVNLSESESDTELTPSQLKPPLAGLQSATAPKPANPNPTPQPSSKSSGHPTSLPSLNATLSSTNGTRTASSSCTASGPRLSATSHVTDPLPPNLDDIGAVVAWALGLAEEKACAPDQGHPLSTPSTSRSHPDIPSTSTTFDHLSRAIANHRSQLNRSGP